MMLSVFAERLAASFPSTKQATIFAKLPREIKLVRTAACQPLSSARVPAAAFMALPTAVAVKYPKNP